MGASASSIIPNLAELNVAQQCVDGMCTLAEKAAQYKDVAASITPGAGTVISAVSSAMDAKYHWQRLTADVEAASSFVAALREQLERLTGQTTVRPCSLQLLMDALQSYETFIQDMMTGTQKKDALQTGMMSIWPKWYRKELHRHQLHVMYSLQLLQSDLQITTALVQALKEDKSMDKTTRDRMVRAVYKRCPKRAASGVKKPAA